MSKKLLALLLAMIMIVGSFTSVFAAETTAPADDKKAEEKVEEKTEEKAEEPAKTEEKEEEKKEEEPVKTNDEALDRAIKVLKKAGFITGYSADSDDFKVEKNVKRSEFASMIVRAMGLEKSAQALATIPTGFKDVPTNHWANGYIAVAKQQGFVNGYTDGTFRPDRQISYQDMATMLTIALGQAEVGTVYPAGYVVKAQQLGLFNNVNVPAYTDMATRGDVFKMLYNMITSKEFGERKIVKAIVLENSRVENMDDDEIVVEVIKVVQEANWVGASRTKRGDQYKYKLDKDLNLDPEDLLGKVIDLTTNKDDKIVNVTVDKTYNYFEGRITNVDFKKFELNWNTYTALFDERYAGEDERIYRTYLNDEDKKYEDFAKYYEKGKYDFARVTVKNGKVIFIDAFQFDDIAPVEELKHGDVYYYDDMDNARVKRAARLGTRLTFSSNGVYSVGEKKLVAKDDVIHFYGDYTRAIVRKDAKIEKVMSDTHRDRYGDEYVVLEDKNEYYLHNDHPFKAIYSYEGKDFRVVEGRVDLNPIRGRKVKALIALDDSVQLVQSDLAWNDGINAIRKITSYGEVKLLPAKGAEFYAKEGRDTYYYDATKVNNTLLHNDFKLDDIVFYTGEGEEGKDQTISTMGLIIRRNEALATRKGNIIPAYAKAQNRTLIDEKTITRFEDDNDHNIVYRYFDNLNAYYIDVYGDLQQVSDMAKFVANNKTNAKLKSYVMSEAELRDLILGNNAKSQRYDNPYHFLSDDNAAKKVARVVVFTDTTEKLDVEQVYAQVTDKYNDTNPLTTVVKFVDADGKTYSVDIRSRYGVGATEINEGDIVDLRIFKDSMDKEVMNGFVKPFVNKDKTITRPAFLTKRGAPAKQPIVSKKYRETYWVDFNGDGKETEDEIFFFSKDTKVFNDRKSGYAQFVYDENNFIEVIRFTDLSDEMPAPEQAEFKFIDEASTRTDGRFLVLYNKDGEQTSVRILPETRLYDEFGKYYGIGFEAAKNFVNAYKDAEVKLSYDRDGKLIDIRVIETKAQRIARTDKENLEKARKIIENLGKQVYTAEEVATTRQDYRLRDKIAHELFLAGLKTNDTPTTEATDKVQRVTTTPGTPDGNGDGVMKTTIKSGSAGPIDVETKFHIISVKEANEAIAKAIADAVKGLKIDVQKGSTLDEITPVVITHINNKLAEEKLTERVTADQIEVTKSGTAYKVTLSIKTESTPTTDLATEVLDVTITEK